MDIKDLQRQGYSIRQIATATGTYKDLHDFGGTIVNADGSSGPDGQRPPGTLALDNEGNLYGTTYDGGPFASSGMVWVSLAARWVPDSRPMGTT